LISMIQEIINLIFVGHLNDPAIQTHDKEFEGNVDFDNKAAMMAGVGMGNMI